MSAHHRHRRRALLVLPALPVLLLLIGTLLGLPLPGTAAAAVPTPTAALRAPSSSTPGTGDVGDNRGAGQGGAGQGGAEQVAAGEVPEEVVTVLVTSVRPRIVRPDDELVVRARIRNDTADTLRSPRATLRVNRFLQSTRSSLEQWAERPLAGTAGTPIATVELDGPLEAGDSADVELRVLASALGLSTADAAWGPRGLSVEAVDGGRREGIERTFVLWQPTDRAVTPTRVTVLVPLTGGPLDPTATEPLPTVPSQSPTTDDPTTGAPTTDAPGDEAPGTDAPPTAGTSDPTDDATDDGDPSPQPGTGDADVDDGGRVPATSPVLRGTPSPDDLDRLGDVLKATADRTDVSWAVDPALLVGARSPDAGPRAQRWVDRLTDAAAGREVLALPVLDPDLAGLAHGGGDGLAFEAYARARDAVDPVLGPTPRAGLAWPADDVPDRATVGLAARSGATTVVVGPGALAAEPLTYTPTGRATIPTPDGDLAALVPDAVLTEELRTPSGTTAAVAAQRMLAESAVITRERPNAQRHVLLTAPRDWTPDPRLAGAQLDALASAPWVDLSDLSALAEAADPGLTRTRLPEREVSDDEIPPGDITALGAARGQLAAFARIVPDPERLLLGVDDAVLAPVSVAWRVDPVQRSLVVDGVVADLTARRSGVSVVPGSDLNLISETGRFPLGLRNDLDQDATVQVVADPASPLLVVDGPQTVTIPADSETQVRVPFHAVGSGDVRVVVSLVSPDGVALGPPQELTVRVRADWENVGTAVVAALLGLALVVGIVRTIRRGQTRRRGAGSTPVSEIARLPEDPS